MNKLKNAFYRFMYGRYGTDALSKAMLWCYSGVLILYLILYLVFSFAFGDGSLGMLILNICYFLLSGTLVYLLISRMFSRNIYKRASENQLFLSKTAKARGWLYKQKNLFAQRKTHRIYKCPTCKQKIRVPKGKGRIEIRCPKCSTKFIKKS